MSFFRRVLVRSRADPFTLASDQNDTSRDAGLFTDVPILLGASPSSGFTAGGVAVTLRGANFRNVTQVLFGSRPATFQVLSPTQIRAIAPSGFAGTVDIRVASTRGLSAIRSSARFTYSALPPPPGGAPPSASEAPPPDGLAAAPEGRPGAAGGCSHE